MGEELPLLPETLPDDPEDVVWGLQTATTLWARGEHREALTWVRRAAEAAGDAGADLRAVELAKRAVTIEEYVATLEAHKPKASATPPPPPAKPLISFPETRTIPPDIATMPGLPGPPTIPANIGEEIFEERLSQPLLIPDEEEEQEAQPQPPAKTPPPPAVPAAPPPETAGPASIRKAPIPPAPISAPQNPVVIEQAPPAARPLSKPPPPMIQRQRSATLQPGVLAALKAPGIPMLDPGLTPPPSSVSPRAAAGPASGGSAGGETLVVAGAAEAARAVNAAVHAKKKARAPILDPWADDFPVDEAPNTRQLHSSADLGPSTEDDVITSAAPLDKILRHKPPPPPAVKPRGPSTPDTQPEADAAKTANGDANKPPPTARKPTATGPVSGPAPNTAPVPTQVLAQEAPQKTPPTPAVAPAEAPAAPPAAPPAAAPAPAQKPATPIQAAQTLVSPGQHRTQPPPAPRVGPASIAPAVRTRTVPPVPVAAPPPVAAPAPPAPAPQDNSKTEAAPPPSQARSVKAPPPPAIPKDLDAGLKAAPPLSARPAAPVVEKKEPKPGTVPPEQRSVAGLPLERVDALGDLPTEIQERLAKSATILELGETEEHQGFGALVVVSGLVDVCATIADIPAATVPVGGIIPAVTSVADVVSLRAVATSRAKVATWSKANIEESLKSCPWVLEELVRVGDRLAALAGVTMGPLGDLDDESRRQTLDRFRVKTLRPNEKYASAGEENLGLAVVGGGSVLVGKSTLKTLENGDLIFPEIILAGSPAPSDAVAGDGGAILLVAARAMTVELFSTLPMLLEMLRA